MPWDALITALRTAPKEQKVRETIKAMASENVRHQLEKPIKWFWKYFPIRIKNVGEKEKAERQKVYDFKDGKENDEAAQLTADYLIEEYGDECRNIVFSPIPASTSEKNDIRFKDFSEKVCNMTGAINGFSHIKVDADRKCLHKNRKKEDAIRESENYTIDTEWFKGKKVVCWDDVITKGLSYANFAEHLERIGAIVIAGVFLARTHYRVS